MNLKIDKGTGYVTGWKSKGLLELKLPLLHVFLPNIRYFKYKTGIQFNKTPLVVEQNSYATKTLNAYIVYDLDNWRKSALKNFILKSCLFGATNLVKNSDKEKYVYSGYGITFNGNGSWNFGNDLPRDGVVFDVNNSSSSHTDNWKNNFLVLGEGSTYGINGNFGKKKFCIVDYYLKPSKSHLNVKEVHLDQAKFIFKENEVKFRKSNQ